MKAVAHSSRLTDGCAGSEQGPGEGGGQAPSLSEMCMLLQGREDWGARCPVAGSNMRACSSDCRCPGAVPAAEPADSLSERRKPRHLSPEFGSGAGGREEVTGIWAEGFSPRLLSMCAHRSISYPAFSWTLGYRLLIETSPPVSYHATHSFQPLSPNYCLLSFCLSFFPPEMVGARGRMKLVYPC